jgi:hypothetical protein
MVVLFDSSWSLHTLPNALQIGGIKLDQAYRIWLHPDRVREFDQIALAARRNDKNAEAQAEYFLIGMNILTAFYLSCRAGVLFVGAKRMAPDGTSKYELLSPDRIGEIWPHGFLAPCKEYVDIEIYGPVPPWIKITVDAQAHLSEYLIPEFQWIDEYSFVIMRGIEFELGAAQAAVVRILHQAVFDPQNWCYETDIREKVGCGIISNLFKRHAQWPELIEKVGRGRYRLNVHSEIERPTLIFPRRPVP